LIRNLDGHHAVIGACFTAVIAARERGLVTREPRLHAVTTECSTPSIPSYDAAVARQLSTRQMVVRTATEADVEAIRGALVANAGDTSLFQQSERRIRRNLGDFVVVSDTDRLVGCAAVHRHTPANAEILAVAVDPAAQGRGVGTILMQACITRATDAGATFLWLATQKPDYFARYGFVRMSKWRLPLRVVLYKLRLIFEQPLRRWLPALFGRHTFMRLPP